ncbi:MAG: dihydrofolate reductase family protein [SAR324 cluster bacterium]|nr:dihydrofolate reductase family protein [SAR324 cluster bacterium]
MPQIKVTLKAAATLDGKIATKTGQSKWITGKTARHHAHSLRNEHDAILVGINTVLADNPKLTTRGIPEGRSPIRIILDSQCRISPDSVCLADDGTLCLIVVGSNCEESRIRNFEKKSVQVLKAPTPQPQIQWLLPELSRYKIKSLLVEGGSRIHASFIQENLADQLVLFLSGRLIGGNDSLSWCGNLDCLDLELAPRLKIQSIQMIGEDILVFAEFTREFYV